MIQEISSRLLKQLEGDLEQTCFQIKDPFQRWTTALKLIRDAIKKLKTHVNEHPFKDKTEEIPIFKYIKPSFYQWNIYYTELYEIETNLPKDDAEKQIAALELELHYINRFFRQYAFLHQYYKLNADDLDNIYFIRGAEPQNILLPNIPDLDPEFSTSCDYLFSKFKAFENLQEWIVEKLLSLRKNPQAPYQPGTEAGKLQWTDDTINLAEIGIGIFHTVQVNNGSASIADIFRGLEETFHVNLGVPSKRISELRRRKRLGRTQYLDEMKDRINQKFDKENEYDADKGNKRKIREE
ncbi:RteC domain-containing protein [Mucilaginibacter pocheonensis]|uniref:RteC protein n=1 Tax=Mucilaginibacter pocheonensis TaxID=398050 RepID=A0ABU1T973_9SPHI|nr:RteC domain-containing protein [Mucilaginibacter pocheonensis]MDR6941370.1 hypothetical protein [Mucilaginibacter pocheonensis]